ncbi:hypothetical protein [Intestinibacter sp.]|uniref:hypothetical protein n=1 Tax=Intestinibacter sp. TaxID=1965304 RepID=UPI003F15711A
MEDIKQLSDKDFFEVVKIVVFSAIGVVFFFLPLFVNKNIVSPVIYISDLVYLKHRGFVYTCTILFISLVLIKEIIKKEKSLFVRLDIFLKILSLLILAVFLFKNEFIFFEDQDLVQIMKESIFRLVVFFPISAVFLPFLIEYGLLNIFDGCFGGFTKRFFRTSGKNIVIFAVFFFVDSFVGFYLVYRLYREGKLRKNECVNSILNYPILQIYLIIYTANRLRLNFITLIISYLFVFSVVNLILCRIYPIKNIKKTFFVKNKYKEKTYRKNKFKMSIMMYLKNKEKKSLFKYIFEYLNEAINIVAGMVPLLIFSFLFTDFIIKNEIAVNIISDLYADFLGILKMPYPDYIAKSISLGFLNQIYSIEVLNNKITFISRLTVAIIVICQGISFTTNIIFIRRYMRFIGYKDILLVYLEKIVLIVLVVFLIYYFYMGFSA